MFSNLNIPSHLKPSDPRFGPGPSLIPVDHLQKLAATGASYMGTSHRRDAVKKVVKEIQEGLRNYFQLPAGHEVVLGNGGATQFWDMMALGLVEKKSLHFTCGEFSEKCYKAFKLVPWTEAKEVKVAYGEGVEVKEEAGFDVICSSLNETSTGVQMLSSVKLQDPNTLWCVDATSGAAQLPADFKAIDVFYFSPQKVLASDGGLFVAIMSPKAIQRALKIAADKTRYIPESMKLSHAIENSRGHQTYNTPALATLFLLNEQVKQLNQLGFKNVYGEAQRKAKMIYDWAEQKPYLSAFVKEAKYRSECVATIDIDSKYSADDLAKRLRELGVAVDIEGYRKLGRNQLRIALFHNIKYDDLVKLTQTISFAVENTSV